VPQLGVVLRCASKRIFPFLSFSLILCSCAKDHPLSDSQKNEIQATLQAAGRAYSAVQHSAVVSSPVPSSDPALLPLIKILRDKVKVRDCRVRLVAPNAFQTTDFSDETQGIKRTFMLLRMWGEQDCPLSLDFKIGTLLEPSIGRWAVSYDYSYLVTDASYRSLNDVDAIELHGGTSVNGLNSSQVRSETDLTGSIHSQSSGTIRLSSSGKLDGSVPELLNGDLTWTFDFDGFSAQFIRSLSNGAASFSINQESVDSTEFNRYFSLGGDPFRYGSNTDLVH
jgi:hypothetical protein